MAQNVGNGRTATSRHRVFRDPGTGAEITLRVVRVTGPLRDPWWRVGTTTATSVPQLGREPNWTVRWYRSSAAALAAYQRQHRKLREAGMEQIG